MAYQTPKTQRQLSIKVGEIKLFSDNSNFQEWLLCNGSAISRTTYSSLFALIGTSFGIGDGSTTFNIPDFRGRTLGAIGQGSGLTNRTLGQSVGTETHTLTTAELASHNHSVNGSFVTVPGSGGTWSFPTGTTVTAESITNNAGSGNSHNNMQPTLFAGNYFIYAGV